MRLVLHVRRGIFTGLLLWAASTGADIAGYASPMKSTLTFGGVEYLHRWSKAGQNEFTPASDSDLARWHDMITIDVHDAVRNGDQLAEVANRVLGNYQSHGKIVRTD